MSAARRIERASARDYAAFTRLFVELGVPEEAPSEERFVETIVPDAFILRDGDRAVGYAWARRRGDRLHVVHVIADPAHRHEGVGSALMSAIARRGRAAGLRRWVLNVKPENVAARGLYERWGMHAVFASASMRIAWAEVARLASAPGTTTRAVVPAHDARFEEALALSPGELAAVRALGRVVVGAESTDRGDGADDPVGVAVLDRSSSGASPFRVRAPEYARPLLEGLGSHTIPDHDHLRVFVEGDPALEAALAAVGAEPILRALRMEGEIPP